MKKKAYYLGILPRDFYLKKKKSKCVRKHEVLGFFFFELLASKVPKEGKLDLSIVAKASNFDVTMTSICSLVKLVQINGISCETSTKDGHA